MSIQFKMLTRKKKGGPAAMFDEPRVAGRIMRCIAAAKHPYKTFGASRGNDRLMDGTIVRP